MFKQDSENLSHGSCKNVISSILVKVGGMKALSRTFLSMYNWKVPYLLIVFVYHIDFLCWRVLRFLAKYSWRFV